MFDCLARLSKLAVHACFVFDGPDRPQCTQETILMTGAVNLALRLQELLQVFGFDWHVVSQPCCIVVFCVQPRLPRLQVKHRLSWPSSTYGVTLTLWCQMSSVLMSSPVQSFCPNFRQLATGLVAKFLKTKQLATELVFGIHWVIICHERCIRWFICGVDVLH